MDVSDLQSIVNEFLLLESSSSTGISSSRQQFAHRQYNNRNNQSSYGDDDHLSSFDLLEDLFHDVIDMGRLVFQLLEDLLKLERPVFIGVSCNINKKLIEIRSRSQPQAFHTFHAYHF